MIEMTEMDRILEAPGPDNLLNPEEKLIWILGDLMNAVENYFGAENPKRQGHIYCAAARIHDEVLTPLRAASVSQPEKDAEV